MIPGEQTHLLQSDYHSNPIRDFLKNRIINDREISENKTQTIGRKALYATSCALGSVGRIPFINLSIKFAGDNKIYGGVLVYSSFTSFTALMVWAYFKVVDSTLPNMSKEEKEILRAKYTSPKLESILKVFSVSTGVLSQIPYAYLAYAYNAEKLIFPILVFISDSGLPIYSIHLSIKELRRKKPHGEIEEKLQALKGDLCEAIESHRQALIFTASEERAAYVKKIKGCQDSLGDSESQDNLLNSISFISQLSQHMLQRKEEAIWAKYARNTIKGIGFLQGLTLNAAQLIGLGTMAFRGAELIWDNDWFAGSAAAFTGGCYVYLTSKVLVNSSMHLLENALFSPRKLVFRDSLAAELSKKVRTTLKVISILTISLSYGPPAEFVQDYFEGALGSFMQIAYPMGYMLLALNALDDMIDDLTEAYIMRRGSEESKEILQINQNLGRLITLIKESPFLEFAKFMNLLPKEVYDKLTKNLDLSRERIQNLISKDVELESV